MLGGLGLNIDLWTTQFKGWIDFLIGPSGFLRGPLVAYVGIALVGYAIYYALSSGGILFGSLHPSARRNRVSFEGAGTVWGSDRELKDLLNMGDYQRVEGKATTTDYVSIDADGNEQSKIQVTKWSSD